MEAYIEYLISKQKRRCGLEGELTVSDRKKFEQISGERIKKQLEYLFAGEIISIEGITLAGNVLFYDGSRLRSEPLTNLGYFLSKKGGFEIYEKGPTIMSKINSQSFK
ncbi:MAG: hypothetical protein QXP53_00255 [Candidatus Pacearchaeota archaeon]